MGNKMIYGDNLTGKVWFGGKEVDPSRSLRLENKSPSGFSWGYHGSGPAQLALAILLEITDENTALALYQKFKSDIIAVQDVSLDLALPVSTVAHWLKGQDSLKEEG